LNHGRKEKNTLGRGRREDLHAKRRKGKLASFVEKKKEGGIFGPIFQGAEERIDSNSKGEGV